MKSVNEIALLNQSSIGANDNYNFINYLDTSSITKGKIDNWQKLTENFPSRAKRKVRENTIIYSTVRPNQEHYGFFENLDKENSIVSTGFTTIDVISSEVFPRYLYYLLTQKWVTNYLQTIAENSVSAYPSINPSDIGNLKFDFPDLKIQTKIAEIFSTIDQKIAVNNALNDNLEQQIKEHFNHLFNNPNINFEKKFIGDIALLKAGGDKPNVFSLNKMEECNVPIYSNGIEKNGLYGFTNQAEITERCITISARGTIGYTVIRQQPFVPIIRLIVAIPNHEGGDIYLKLIMNSLNFEKSGSVQQQLTIPQLSKMEIPYPSVSTLKEFNEISTPMLEKIYHNEKEINELSTLRNFLLPMLMNGQVKVE